MVINILKDGTILEDLTGHLITREQFPTVYKVIEQIEKEERDDGDQV